MDLGSWAMHVALARHYPMPTHALPCLMCLINQLISETVIEWC